MYDYVNELLKEYQTLFFYVIYMVFLYYFLNRIGYQFDKITKKKEELKDSYGNQIEKLEQGKTPVKTNEDYYKKKREIKEDYHRSLTRVNDDFRSEQLFFISQGIVVIGSLLVVLVLVNVDL